MGEKGFSITDLLSDSVTEKSAISAGRLEQETRELKVEAEEYQKEDRKETGYAKEKKAYLTDLDNRITYPLERAENIIGCQDDCDIVIIEASERHTVSRKHAKITRKDGKFYLTDTSSNGTFIERGGEYLRLPRGEMVEIGDGEDIKFVNRHFRFAVN